MLFQLPDHTTLYAALLARNPAYDGRAFVGVKSTGVFCRLTCPARKPKSENCHFFDTIAQCIETGFRPCKRCHPLAPAAESDPVMQTLIADLEKNPAYRWREGDIISRGLDPSTVRRSFKRQFGITFLEMARLSRIRDGFETLSDGGRVIEAQLDAGFSSPSAFRTAFAKLLGLPPGSFAISNAPRASPDSRPDNTQEKDAFLKADWIDTPLGAMIAVSDKSALHLLEFVDRKALPNELKKLRQQVRGNLGIGRYAPTDQIEAELKEFFAGNRGHFDVPLALHGTGFTREVWHALRNIPVGETRSYSDIARDIGNPAATRAVARANGANQIAIVIPCHRVIGADGSLTGYGGGLWRKQKLIDLERDIRAKG